jgi:malonyl-CoA O-methyltransferase
MQTNNFDTAATTYTNFATIQAQSANQLMATLSCTQPTTILDIGCGTGILTQKLASHYPAATIDAIDQSPAMIQQLREQNIPNVSAICADYIQQPTKQYDLITSNAALHWMDINQSLSKIATQLNPAGQCYVAIFGRNTAPELESLLPKIGKNQSLPAQQFPTNQQLSDIGNRFFSDWRIVTEVITISFDSITQLLTTQKKTGVNANRPTGLWTPTTLALLESAFIEHYNQVQLTYDVHFCSGRKVQ